MLKKYWKPDGKTISKSNQNRLHQWMKAHSLATKPGAITVFIHSVVHESARAHVLRGLNISHK
jgi:hypothetical protein